MKQSKNKSSKSLSSLFLLNLVCLSYLNLVRTLRRWRCCAEPASLAGGVLWAREALVHEVGIPIRESGCAWRGRGVEGACIMSMLWHAQCLLLDRCMQCVA